MVSNTTDDYFQEQIAQIIFKFTSQQPKIDLDWQNSSALQAFRSLQEFSEQESGGTLNIDFQFGGCDLSIQFISKSIDPIKATSCSVSAFIILSVFSIQFQFPQCTDSAFQKNVYSIVSPIYYIDLVAVDTFNRSVVDSETFIRLIMPFNLSAANLSAIEIDAFTSGTSAVCLCSETSDQTSWNSMWSTSGCRLDQINSGIDGNGLKSKNHGNIICICRKFAAYAAAFGVAPLRFVSPTSLQGSIVEVESGREVTVTVKAALSSVVNAKDVVLNFSTISNLTSGWSYPSFDISEICDAQLSMVSDYCIVGSFSWIPRQRGVYYLNFQLFWNGVLFDNRSVTVHVLFCEHSIRAGQTLLQIASIYKTSWKALYLINNISNPDIIPLCGTVSEPPCTLKIGRIIQLSQNKSIVDVVHSLAGVFTQVAMHNQLRIQSISVVSNSSKNFLFNVLDSGESTEICIISKMSSNCN